MSSICWLCFQCHILFLVSCCFSFLPFLSSQRCNETPQSSAPFVEIIQTPSVDPQNHDGSSYNLTCSAKLTNKRYSNPVYTHTQPCKIVWWFNRKKVKSCARECFQAKGEMNCTLPLGGRENQLKAVGNFSCKASNGNYFCTLKRILLKPSFGIRTSEIAPVNQTAPTGCNSTFRCRTGGHPKPALTWIRNGSDSNILNETNPRINITTDPEKDAGPLAAANNVMADSTDTGRVFVIAIPCIAVTLAICGLLYFLWYRKSRRRAKVQGSRRELSAIHNADALPMLPPKPNEEFKADEQVECICIHKGRYSGFDSSESSDKLFSDRETTPNSKSTISLGGHDIEENWQIDSQKLRVFDDEVLGEGEFGIVKKGHYEGKDVAVKQLKGGER